MSEGKLDVILLNRNEVKSCPLKRNGACSVAGKECRFGLTDITVPRWCPLPVTVTREKRTLEEQ